MLPTLLSVTALAFAPYPSSTRPIGTLPLFVITVDHLNSADKSTLQTLSGLLARDSPRIYTLENTDGPLTSAYALWLEQLTDVYGVATNMTYNRNFPGLLALFTNGNGQSGAIRGFVMYNETDGSSNAAFSYCAAYSSPDHVGGVVAVASSDTRSLLESLGVNLVRDFTATTEGVVMDEVESGGARYPANFSFQMGTTSFQDRRITEELVAYSIFARIPMIEYACTGSANATAEKACLAEFPDGGPVEQARLQRMSAALGPNSVGKAMGWGPEGAYVTALLKRGVVVHASDHALDLPPLRTLHAHSAVFHDEIKFPFRQPPLNRERVAAFTAKTKNQENRKMKKKKKKKKKKTRGTHTVSFVMTDGDNVCLLLNSWPTSTKWYGSPDRGKVPLGWTFTPAAVDLMPAVVQWTYSQATANDSFVTAPSGVGYTYVDLGFNSSSDARDLDYAAATASYMMRANQSIINFIDSPSRDPGGDKPGEQPNWDPSSSGFSAMMAQDGIDAAIWYSFGQCYAGAQGDVWWSKEGKPVIGGRIALWGADPIPLVNGTLPKWKCTACGVNCVAERLKSMKLQGDPSYASAYSVIPVHIWDHNVTDVLALATALAAIDDPNQPKFEVVTPAELVARIKANVAPPPADCPWPSGSYHASCRGCAVGGGSSSASLNEAMDCTLRCSCDAGGDVGWQETTCDLRKCSDLSYEKGGFYCGEGEYGSDPTMRDPLLVAEAAKTVASATGLPLLDATQLLEQHGGDLNAAVSAWADATASATNDDPIPADAPPSSSAFVDAILASASESTPQTDAPSFSSFSGRGQSLVSSDAAGKESKKSAETKTVPRELHTVFYSNGFAIFEARSVVGLTRRAARKAKRERAAPRQRGVRTFSDQKSAAPAAAFAPDDDLHAMRLLRLGKYDDPAQAELLQALRMVPPRVPRSLVSTAVGSERRSVVFLLRARRDIPLPPVSQLQRLGSEDEEEDCGGFFGMTGHSLKSAGGNEGSATLQTLSAIPSLEESSENERAFSETQVRMFAYVGPVCLAVLMWYDLRFAVFCLVLLGVWIVLRLRLVRQQNDTARIIRETAARKAWHDTTVVIKNALRVDPSSGTTTLTTLRVRGVGLSTMLDFNPDRHTVRDLFLRVRSELCRDSNDQDLNPWDVDPRQLWSKEPIRILFEEQRRFELRAGRARELLGEEDGRTLADASLCGTSIRFAFL